MSWSPFSFFLNPHLLLITTICNRYYYPRVSWVNITGWDVPKIAQVEHGRTTLKTPWMGFWSQKTGFYPRCHIASMLCIWGIWSIEKSSSSVMTISSHAELGWQPSVFDRGALATSTIAPLIVVCLLPFAPLSLLDYQDNCSQWSSEWPDLSNLKNPILLMNSTLLDMKVDYTSKAELVSLKSFWNSVPYCLNEGW